MRGWQGVPIPILTPAASSSMLSSHARSERARMDGSLNPNFEHGFREFIDDWEARQVTSISRLVGIGLMMDDVLAG